MVKGVISYGTYLPLLRIRKEEYVKAWGEFSARGVKEKTVMDFDEDVLTMSVAAAKDALCDLNESDLNNISYLCMASTSYPYDEKIMAGSLIEMLGLRQDVFSTEHRSSSRAGTEAFITAWRLAEDANALVVAGESPNSKWSNPLDHGLGAAAVGFVMGEHNVVAEIEGYRCTVRESMGERFRPYGQGCLDDLGLTGMHTHIFEELVTETVKSLMFNLNTRSVDYNYVVVQQPDGRRPVSIAKKLGFKDDQINPGLVVDRTGDTGVCSTLLSLVEILDGAKPGERVLLVSYGSGAGSDAISLRITDNICSKKLKGLASRLEVKKYIDYVQYLKLKQKSLERC